MSSTITHAAMSHASLREGLFVQQHALPIWLGVVASDFAQYSCALALLVCSLLTIVLAGGKVG